MHYAVRRIEYSHDGITGKSLLHRAGLASSTKLRLLRFRILVAAATAAPVVAVTKQNPCCGRLRLLFSIAGIVSTLFFNPLNVIFLPFSIQQAQRIKNMKVTCFARGLGGFDAGKSSPNPASTHLVYSISGKKPKSIPRIDIFQWRLGRHMGPHTKALFPVSLEEPSRSGSQHEALLY